MRAQAADTVATETRELNTLLGIARNEKISKEQRMEAIKRLNALSEEYLGGLRLETINTREATAAVKDYTDNLLSMARIRSANSRLEEIQKEKGHWRNNVRISMQTGISGTVSNWGSPKGSILCP